MLTMIVAIPSVYDVCPAMRTHGRSVPPKPKPVVEPVTTIRLPSREPLMTTVDRGAATGVTVLDGSEEADQPAPVSALTVKVYAVPFDRPETSHDIDGAVTRQVRPPGEEATWYVDTGKEPAEGGAVHETRAEALPATALTSRGASEGIGGGGGRDAPWTLEVPAP